MQTIPTCTLADNIEPVSKRGKGKYKFKK